MYRLWCIWLIPVTFCHRLLWVMANGRMQFKKKQICVKALEVPLKRLRFFFKRQSNKSQLGKWLEKCRGWSNDDCRDRFLSSLLLMNMFKITLNYASGARNTIYVEDFFGGRTENAHSKNNTERLMKKTKYKKKSLSSAK